MKVIYQFDHDEDYDKFNIFQQAEGMHSVLWALDQELRGIVKHGDESPERDFAERWRSRLHDLMDENGVTLD